jgi:hypothetical protein
MLPGKTDAKWCDLAAPGACGPEPAWYGITAGWLYEMQGKSVTAGRNYLWYTNGYEMDVPLGYVPGPLATAIISHAVRCK